MPFIRSIPPLAVQGSDGIAFDFTMTTRSDRDVCLTLTLMDDSGLALCIGMGKYGAGNGAVAFGMTTDVSKNFYNFKDSTSSITAVTSAGTLAANDTAAISGLIMMNENNRVVVTLPVSGSETPATLELGENFTLNKIIVSYEGKGGASDYPTISGLTLKVLEPATATLSLLALAGLAARRRRH